MGSVAADVDPSVPLKNICYSQTFSCFPPLCSCVVFPHQPFSSLVHSAFFHSLAPPAPPPLFFFLTQSTTKCHKGLQCFAELGIFFSSFPAFCFCRPIIKHFRPLFDVSWRSLFSTDCKFIFLLPPFPFRKVKETRSTHFSKSSVLVSEKWRQAARNRHCFFFVFFRLPIIPLTLWSEHNLYSCLNTAWGRPKQCAVYTEPRDT